MFTIKQCREILEKGKTKIYTEEEIAAIRDFLYKLAKLNVEFIRHRIKIKPIIGEP